jgi:hypothetical protein
MAKHVAFTREMRKAYKILVGKPKKNKPLERQRHRWEDNIQMDFKETGCEDVDWTHVTQDRVQW